MTAKPSKQPKLVRVAIQFSDGKRFADRLPATMSLWDILLQFQQNDNLSLVNKEDDSGKYLMPQLAHNRLRFSNIRELQTTIQSLPIDTKAGVLFDISWRISPFSIQDLPDMIADAKSEAERKKAETERRKSNPYAIPQNPQPANTSPKRQRSFDPIGDKQRRPNMDDDWSVPLSDQHDFSKFDRNMGKISRQVYGLTKVVPAGDKFDTCFKTLKVIFSNVMKEPKQEKFRQLRVSNEKLIEKVLQYEGALDLLKLSGFVEDSENKELLIFPDENVDINLLTQTVNLVLKARPVVKEAPIPVVKRCLKVYSAEQLRKFRAEQSVLAKSEKVTRDGDSRMDDVLDKRALNRAARETSLRNKMANPNKLMSKDKHRELLGIQNKTYNLTVIQVEFPSGLVLEGRFHPREASSKLFEFVTTALDPDLLGSNFELVLPPTQSLNQPLKSFQELALIPAATVRFRTLKKKYSGRYLQTELLNAVSTEIVPVVTEQKDSEMADRSKKPKKKTAANKMAFMKNFMKT